MRTYIPKPEWIILDWHHACIAAEVLCVQKCSACGVWRHPPRRFCASCFSDDVSFQPVTGNGTVLSKAVSHRSLDPGWQEQAPYATLLVELAEGPRVLAATSVAPDEIEIGHHVAVRIDPHGHDFVLVWADPVSTTTSSLESTT
jgi:uncharacterized OB-fold protein